MLPLKMTEQGMISPVKKKKEGAGGGGGEEDKKNKENDNVCRRPVSLIF